MELTDRLNPIHLLVLDSELAALRGGLARNACFQLFHTRCLAYVLGYRGYRRLLSVEDGEEIVSQAVVEELSCIENPAVGAAETSLRVQRALNRGRARYARAAKRRFCATPALIAHADADMVAAIQYKEIARNLRGFIGLAIDALRERDRNLLIDHYGLERFGLIKRGASPAFPSEGASRVGLFRARRRFLRELRRLLEAASAGRDGQLALSLPAVLGSRFGRADAAAASVLHGSLGRRPREEQVGSPA